MKEDRIYIENENLYLLHIIGEGFFGSVFRGILESDEEKKEVAVKTLKSGNILSELYFIDLLLIIIFPYLFADKNYNEEEIESFVREGIIMKDFDHKHVLKLHGVCFDSDRLPMVVIPYMENGDLLSYIRNEMNSPTVKDLINYAIQVADGINFMIILLH